MTASLPIVYYSCLCMHGLVRLPSLPSVLSSLLYTATILYTYLVFIITASRMLNLCYYLVCLCYRLLALLTHSCIPCYPVYYAKVVFLAAHSLLCPPNIAFSNIRLVLSNRIYNTEFVVKLCEM